MEVCAPRRHWSGGQSHSRTPLTLMHIRGQNEVYTRTPAQALGVVDGEHRTKRLTMPPVSAS